MEPLSLSQNNPCGDMTFSDLGAVLDDRSKRFNVQFVVAAGNYIAKPYRGWPPQKGIGEADRICPPADSTRAITVGSLAHLGTTKTRVQPEEPSPFSRRGPGPAYIIKPELSVPGGNCDRNGLCTQTGVISIDGSGHIAEDAGTSFACAPVSALTANVLAELEADPKSATPLLARALMYHASFVKNPLPDRHRINYTGLGRPPELGAIVGCRQSSATVVFEVPLQSGLVFTKHKFPMPNCLVDSKAGLVAEVFMTLLYEPPLDPSGGVEYCRCNVEASLGTMGRDKEGKSIYIGTEIPPFPEGVSEGREKHLIEYGYKWSPLKLYYRRFKRGPSGKDWRLTLRMLEHSGDVHDEQHAVLIITIRDPAGKQPVYNELSRRMKTLAWDIHDLQVKSRSRLRQPN